MTVATDTYIAKYLEQVGIIAEQVDTAKLSRFIEILIAVRNSRARLFFLGVGGGAANASHAVNDFRKIAGIESYAPTDNVAELTARVNDNGWDSVFLDWLKTNKLGSDDAVFVFSVGGGSEEKNISSNIVKALRYASGIGAKILGIVGRDGGFTAEVADCSIIVPVLSADTVTAHTESFQAVLWHLIVSHPKMKVAEMKWESTV